MSLKNSDDPQSPINAQLKSSIVHKPFATGTINIFNPYRTKGNKTAEQLDRPQSQEAQLATNEQPNYHADSVEDHEQDYEPELNWLDWVLNPWAVKAIAIIFLVNLIAGAAIWRNFRAQKTTLAQPSPSLGSANLANEEFMPLNLSTLSRLKTTENIAPPAVVAPIPPALAPIDSINLEQSTIDPQYYYVLTEYTGDSSLALARQKVKQVSLVNFPQGVFIYLGAYQERGQAEEFINQLKQENFSAHIYPHN